MDVYQALEGFSTVCTKGFIRQDSVGIPIGSTGFMQGFVKRFQKCFNRVSDRL